MSCPHPEGTQVRPRCQSLRLGRGSAKATHLGSWSALLSRRPWLSLRSLETSNQRGPGQAQAGVRLRSDRGQKMVKNRQDKSFEDSQEDRGRKEERVQTGIQQGWIGTGRGKGQGLCANHSPSSLWGHGDHPCLGLPETQDRVSRLEAGARPGALRFLGSLAMPEGGQQTPDHSCAHHNPRLARPVQICRVWVCGFEGCCFVSLEDFCWFWLQPEPWCPIPHGPSKVSWGEARAGINGVHEWKSSQTGEEERKQLERVGNWRGQG